MAIMAATVWFIPGWLRSEKPADGVLECVTNAFPAAQVEFKAWDGDNVVWPLSVDSADKESWRFAFEIAMMPKEERESLTLIGHSLGGRIIARILARLEEHGMKIRQAILMGAAIPSDDPDLEKMGRASALPVLAVCNPDDVVLRYVYTMVGAVVGGEKATAFGANGTPSPCENVVECVTPTNITRQVEIGEKWAKMSVLKDIANHHEKFYIGYAKRLLDGEEPIQGRYADTLPTDIYEKAAEHLGDTARCEEDVLSYIAFPPVAEKFFAERKAREERLCRYSIEAVEE